MKEREYTPADRLFIGLDQALKTIFGQPAVTERPDPASKLPEADLNPESGLSKAQQEKIARLMRINHTGEVCAQGLYQGQALTARKPEVQANMSRASQEENDHLAWCEGRLKAFGNHKSLLNPLWYAGSFTLGAAAGLAGDKWSLGFVAETEKQVVKHLEGHLAQIPASDIRSRAVLEQMKADEQQHANQAISAGGVELPEPVRIAMKLSARVMTKTVYWV
ncbi:MAG: 2-polyprenyl-3-methyl-6-methoxy-1,4-benzoquinone monooxygenase [Gammaproteobacteria bacterium]|nr:2-polyprenyl-3-methyl-6-methoxy-1,4-benzoquinone monooxygenase [Gammaproteobacteria bacterium]